jgi:hypothetical protein
MARSPRTILRASLKEGEMKTTHLHDLPCFRGHLQAS